MSSRIECFSKCHNSSHFPAPQTRYAFSPLKPQKVQRTIDERSGCHPPPTPLFPQALSACPQPRGHRLCRGGPSCLCVGGCVLLCPAGSGAGDYNYLFSMDVSVPNARRGRLTRGGHKQKVLAGVVVQVGPAFLSSPFLPCLPEGVMGSFDAVAEVTLTGPRHRKLTTQPLYTRMSKQK